MTVHGDLERAIAMAQAGGIGVIHRNLDPEAQAREVSRVKRFESGVVYQPITLTPDQTLADAKTLMERYAITGFPVVDEAGRVVGIVTNRDMRFASDDKTPVRVMMTSDNLALLQEPADLEAAKKALSTYEADAKEAPRLRERTAELERVGAEQLAEIEDQRAILETIDGVKAEAAHRALNAYKAAAYAGGLVSLILGVATVFLYVRSVPASPEGGGRHG